MTTKPLVELIWNDPFISFIIIFYCFVVVFTSKFHLPLPKIRTHTVARKKRKGKSEYLFTPASYIYFFLLLLFRVVVFFASKFCLPLSAIFRSDNILHTIQPYIELFIET